MGRIPNSGRESLLLWVILALVLTTMFASLLLFGTALSNTEMATVVA